MDPSYNNSFGTPMQGGAAVPGGSAPGAGQQPASPIGGGAPVQQPAVSGGGGVPMQQSMPSVGGGVQMPYQPSIPTNMGAPMSMGTGDIILSNEPKKKKIGVVLLIVLIALIVLVGVGYLIWSNTGTGGEIKTAGVKGAFNRYANYFMYGEDESDKFEVRSVEADTVESEIVEVGDIEVTESIEAEVVAKSYFEKQTKTLSAERVEYFKNIETYFGDFYDVYSKVLNKGQSEGAEQDGDAEILSALNNYSNKLKVVTNYYEGNIVVQPMVVDKYLAGGESDVKELIDSTLAIYKDVGEIYGMNYYNIALKRANEMLDLVKLYKAQGCVVDDGVDYDCAFAIENEEANTLKMAISDDYYDMMAIINNSVDDLYAGVFSFDTLINGADGGGANEN